MNLFRLLFSNIAKNSLNIFRPRNLVWHGLAILLTVIIVNTGLDWWYFSATRNYVVWPLIWPAVILGFILPVFVPLIMYVIGWIRKQAGTMIVAAGLGQAALLGLLTSYLYKAFTGRLPPEVMGGVESLLVDTSHGFQFGFWRNGIFWGWPSSHTTVAFAMTVALIVMYPKNKKVYWLALIYAFYVGISISVSIHWLSEFIAGAIFGTVVGVVVGRAFKQKRDTND